MKINVIANKVKQSANYEDYHVASLLVMTVLKTQIYVLNRKQKGFASN